jgi:phosphate transport system protein
MTLHLQREIDNLKKDILGLGSMVELSVHDATKSIEGRDGALAKKVIEKDIEIDRKEVDVEESCLKVLALHQPVANDLRFIIAVLKINNDLERIGDLAVNIAERAAFLANQPKVDISFDFLSMAQKAQAMLKDSLDALVNQRADLAAQVCASDDVIDEINREMYLKVQDAIHSHPEQTESLIHLLSVSRHLERIADCATNIAEDVIYMAKGEIVRHKVEQYQSNTNPSFARRSKPNEGGR